MSEQTKPQKTESVQEMAEGRWFEILFALSPNIRPAIYEAMSTGGHSPCPVHGGKDGFRFFNDGAQRGAGICNTCGAFSSGMKLANWLNENKMLHADESYTPPKRREGETDESFSFRDTYKKVAHFLNHGYDLYPPFSMEEIKSSLGELASRTDTRTRAEKDEHAKQQAEEQWKAALKEKNDSVITGYFRQRGLGDMPLPSVLKVAKNVPYTSPKEPTSYHFCILAPLAFSKRNPKTDVIERKFIAMHRIYLDPVPYSKQEQKLSNEALKTTTDMRFPATPLFKKAEVDTPKKTARWGDYQGAAVMLFGPMHKPRNDTNQMLIVGEGVETTLAFAHMCPLKVPTYASLVAGNLAAFEIPDDMKDDLTTVMVAGDYDKYSEAGASAFAKLKEKLHSEHPHLTIVEASPQKWHEYCKAVAIRAANIPEAYHEQLFAKGIDWDSVLAVANNFDTSILQQVIDDIGSSLDDTAMSNLYKEKADQAKQELSLYANLANDTDNIMR